MTVDRAIADARAPIEAASEREEAAAQFVLALAESLHRYGASADRLEDALTWTAGELGLEARFFAAPTSFIASFDLSDGNVTRMLRMHPGGIELGKLVAVDRLMNEVASGNRTPVEGLRELRAISEEPPRFGPVAEVATFAAASGLVTPLFGGHLAELVAATLAGTAIALLARFFARRHQTGLVIAPVAAALAAISGQIASRMVDGTSSYVIAVSALIIMMPGLKLTIGMRELATEHLTAGTTRLTSAIMTLLGMGLGVAMGDQIGANLPAFGHISGFPDMPSWSTYVSLALFPPALMVLHRARPVDIGVITAGCLISWFGARFGVAIAGPEVGAFLGALAVGIAGNLYARRYDRPSSTLQIPGVTLLVPGSIGFRSVFSLLGHDTLSGLEAAATMIFVGSALVFGLLFANIIVKPRKVL